MSRFKNVAGIIGNPSFYSDEFRDFSEKTLQLMKKYQFDTVFVNIAWSRPYIDAVVPEHIVRSERYPLLSPDDCDERFKLFKMRTDSTSAAGLKAFATFGIPEYKDFSLLPEEYRVLKGANVSPLNTQASVKCISRTEVLDLYCELFGKIIRSVPNLSGVVIYNYDELADICDEDSDCPLCHGKPADKRIADFLNNLYKYIISVKPDFELWWEPWELSAAQVYSIMEYLDSGIGVSCHSTINEVYFINEGDTWLRIAANMAKKQNRKFIAEIFMGGSGEDLGIVGGYPCPRLVYRQLLSLDNIQSITGIKEYYGNAVPYFSINERVFAECVDSPHDVDYNKLIHVLASEYSDQPDKLEQFWDLTADVVEMIPWELSWVMRLSNYPVYSVGYWGKIPFPDLMKTPWDSPSWLSNRRSYYIVTANTSNYTHRLVLDLKTRFEFVFRYISQAINLFDDLSYYERYNDEMYRQREALQIIKHQLLCRYNHMLISESVRELKLNMEALPSFNIGKLLESDYNNAIAFRDLLKYSKMVYLLTPEYLESSIENIKECRKIYNYSIAEWMKIYNF